MNRPGEGPAFSHTIDSLRGILMAFVVLIHTNLLSDTGAVDTFYAHVYDYSSEVLWLCNALFFFTSGYLFFLTAGRPTLAVYLSKLRRRLHTLVIPYFLWNTIVLLILSAVALVLPSLASPQVRPLHDMTWTDFIQSYFCAYGQGLASAPVDIPLWFLRNLIAVSILAPIFHLVIRLHRASLAAILLLALLPIDSASQATLLYFGLGCYCSIWRTNILQLVRRHTILTTLLFLMFIIIQRNAGLPTWADSLLNATKNLMGMATLVAVCPRHASPWRTRLFARYHDALFFVFALHSVIARPLTKLAASLLMTYNLPSVAYIPVHLLNTLICIIVCVNVYEWLYRVSPAACKLLGARG